MRGPRTVISEGYNPAADTPQRWGPRRGKLARGGLPQQPRRFFSGTARSPRGAGAPQVSGGNRENPGETDKEVGLTDFPREVTIESAAPFVRFA